MGLLRKICLLLFLPLFAFATVHKFYLSVSSVEYSEKDRALQITTRVFIDDFDGVLQERYGIRPLLGAQGENAVADEYIGKYLKSKFLVSVDGKQRPFTFLGKEYEADMMVCYLEVAGVDLETAHTIEVQNEVLMDRFEDQKNVVHFRIADRKKSYVLISGNNKGSLNLE